MQPLKHLGSEQLGSKQLASKQLGGLPPVALGKKDHSKVHTPQEKGTSASSQIGLSNAQVKERLKQEGYNELPSTHKRSFWRILREVLREPMFALLLAGGVIYLLLGDTLEALLLLVFACFSVAITLIQESRSERVLEALRDLASPRALVIRDGKQIHIPSREVVREDIIVVTEGDRVAADATLISTDDLLLDESLLTGESQPVQKQLASLPKDAAIAPGGENTPHIFAGTLVVRGRGQARVHATGLKTEMGKIGHALGSIETEQPRLQLQLRKFVRNYAIIGLVAAIVTVLLFGLLRGSWLPALLGGIALGMSLLPEEFPLVLAVFMAMGAWRISQVRVLTRRAAAIETLGATTVLCTDKTGTLTENRMTLTAIISGKNAVKSAPGQNAPGKSESFWKSEDHAPLTGDALQILQAALLASTFAPSDPMDKAIQTLVRTHIPDNIDQLKHLKVLRAFGLRPDLFAVTNIVAGVDNSAMTAYTKGALETIAQLCHLTPENIAAINAQANHLANLGIRVLGVAKTTNLPEGKLPDSPRDISFEYLGLIGFADPLRSNVPAAVAECRTAGIRVLMVTGDYPTTALAIGKQAGLDVSTVITGDEIEAMSDDQLALSVKTTSIFARIRPTQKLRIVQSLKANGEIVAMTGDGVNDAPALKAAHIGIAMGERGTDVAREASAIVLLDDDFGSIVKTIRLGRRIYDNLRKAIEYIIAVHIPIAGLAILPLMMGLPLMLTPIHIAFLEMVIDPTCSVVFEAEEEEKDIMTRPPRDPQTSLLLPQRIWWGVVQGAVALVIAGAALIGGTQFNMPEDDLRALVFTVLVLTNIGLILVNRSFSASLIRAFFNSNRLLWILLSVVVTLLAISVFWPPAQRLFHFGQLQGDNLVICALASMFGLILLEAIKAKWFRIPHRKTLSQPAITGASQ
ncbi:MAG: cation-translocating P-type ATPase [Pseudomonadota bacterium]